MTKSPYKKLRDRIKREKDKEKREKIILSAMNAHKQPKLQ